MKLYIELFFLGLPIAGLFALMATGVVMVYRASRILNLAMGGMGMFTAYILYQTHKWGAPLPLALILALGFAAWLGWAMERFLLRPLRDRPLLVSVIMTVGVLAVLTSLATLIWTADRQTAPELIPSSKALRFFGITLGYDRLFILFVTAVLMSLVIYLFKYTTLGIAMRAASDDRSSSLLMGIPVDRLSSLTWVLGSILAGCAGILLSPVIGLQPFNLTLLAIPAYAAAVFGGLNSLPLTLMGAGIIGVMFSEIPSLPLVGTQSDFPGGREIAIFAAVVLFLFFRWQSLFGSGLREEEI